jgi:hypothetical protein
LELLPVCLGVFNLAEEVKLKITERDDIADLLGLIPTWIISAVVWYAFTKIILDRFTDKKPGTEINLAIIASDVAGVTFPPGVALAAQLDVSLTALGIGVELAELFKKPPGVQPAETIVELFYKPAIALSKFLEFIVVGVPKK